MIRTATVTKAEAARIAAVTLLRSWGWDASPITTRRGNAVIIRFPDKSAAFLNTLSEAKRWVAWNGRCPFAK